MSQTPSSSIPLDRLPLGFRFRPTDEELINNYLKLKINGKVKPTDAAAIAEVDVCRFEPWDLPARSAIRSDDPEWFFFAPVDRKYPSSNRSNRATEAGYWKATGKDRFIRSRTRGVVGMKKTLVFHRGRAPRGERSCWIMHEYRAVEPEFEESGFVLCRLFRKPEETVSGTITPEPEESGFSPTPTKSSPSKTLHIDDVVKGKFAVQLNKKSPESNMLEESQPLPDTINNQLTESKLDDKAFYLIPYPNKPEESHSNVNTTTDEGSPMAERKDAALYDDLLAFLGPEYEHLLSDEFPQINAISSDVDQGLHTQFQFPKLEEDSVLDFESMVITPEMSSGLSANEAGSATKAVLQQRSCAVHEGSWNSFMDNDTCSSRDVDAEALFAQGGEGLETSSHERRLLGTSGSSQPDTSNRHNEICCSMKVDRSIAKRSKRKLTAPLEGGTLPSHSTEHAKDLVGPTNSLETEINIRLRNLENLESSSNFPRQQGIAERRIRLQSPKHLGKATEQASYESKTSSQMLFNNSSTASSYRDDLQKLSMWPDLLPAGNSNEYHNLSGASFNGETGRWAGIIISKAEVPLNNQDSRRIEVHEPAFAGDDHECFSSDDDGSSYPYQVCAVTLEEYEEPSLRLRTRQLSDATSDAEIKPERLSLHQRRSTFGSVPICRIGIAVFVTLSLLFAGTVWFFNS